ncbi:MAG: hypothetical protein EXS14_08295 [Planctomycetes bacterium]|nr:hypothetical protein [Planctomycetota bacterium]
MLALDTRTSVTRARGLGYGIDALAALAPSALLLDPVQGGAQGDVGAALSKANVPVLGWVWRAADPERQQLAGEDRHADAASSSVAAALELLPRYRARTLVLSCGSGGLRDVEAVRDAASTGKSSELAALRVKRKPLFEAAVERLVRRLHVLCSTHAGAQLLLRVEADPATLLTVESAEWMLAELGNRGLGIALDVGAAGLSCKHTGLEAEGWLAQHGRSVGLVLLSDHDGITRCDLLPGLGLTPCAHFANLRAGGAQRVMCLDPELEPSALLLGARFALDLCGPR